jgi:hypothetical protein
MDVSDCAFAVQSKRRSWHAQQSRFYALDGVERATVFAPAQAAIGPDFIGRRVHTSTLWFLTAQSEKTRVL